MTKKCIEVIMPKTSAPYVADCGFPEN